VGTSTGKISGCRYTGRAKGLYICTISAQIDSTYIAQTAIKADAHRLRHDDERRGVNSGPGLRILGGKQQILEGMWGCVSDDRPLSAWAVGKLASG
jgi:hypothetical protein